MESKILPIVKYTGGFAPIIMNTDVDKEISINVNSVLVGNPLADGNDQGLAPLQNTTMPTNSYNVNVDILDTSTSANRSANTYIK